MAKFIESTQHIPAQTTYGSLVIPPLLGDGAGHYRVNIVGNSGVGKSTLARELAAMLNVPCILLDTLYWKPDWGEATRDEFRARVRAALEQDQRGWVVDGNYAAKLGDMMAEKATDVIWLDPPLILYFPRLCWRTVLRLLRLAPPCSLGCEERVSEVLFSHKSILWWCLSNHWANRKRQAENQRTDGVHTGGKHRRIGGWGGELAAWKRDMEEMVRVRAEGSDVVSIPKA